CVRCACVAAIAMQESYFTQQFIWCEPKQCTHAWILQWSYSQIAPLENRREPARNPSTKSAIRIKKKPPPCVPPFAIHVFTDQGNHGSPCRFLRAAAEKSNHFAPQLRNALQRPTRHAQDFFKHAAHHSQKLQHAFEPLACICIALRVLLQLLNALRDHAQCRIDFPPFPLFRNDAKNLPDVLDTLKMVAPVAEHMNHAHDSPSLQFAQARAHVRSSHGKCRRNLVRREGLRRQKQQRMDLRDRTVNPPSRAHLSPMQDELLGHRGKCALLGSILFAHGASFLLKRPGISFLVLLSFHFSNA